MKEDSEFVSAVKTALKSWQQKYEEHFAHENTTAGIVRGLRIALDLHATMPTETAYNVEDGPEVPLMTAHRILKDIYGSGMTGPTNKEKAGNALLFIESWRREL